MPYSIIETCSFARSHTTVRIALIDAADALHRESRPSPGWHGYSDISILDGTGNARPGRAPIYEVFQGVNVPSKAIGEVVEHAADTPRIAAEELNTMMEAGENMVIVDGRTHRNIIASIPERSACPMQKWCIEFTIWPLIRNGRWWSTAPAAPVDHWEERRSSMQGLPNRVVALKAGTMGWTLAGFELDHGSNLRYPDEPTADGAAGLPNTLPS